MTTASGRIGRLSADVRSLTDRIPDDDVDDCLGRLALVVIDVSDIGACDPVRDALAQWQTSRRVSVDTRRRLEALMVQRDVDGFAAHRSSDVTTQRAARKCARCVVTSEDR